jgi:hypothetical protein
VGVIRGKEGFYFSKKKKNEFKVIFVSDFKWFESFTIQKTLI